MHQLLARLERYDTVAAPDALRAALFDVFGALEPAPDGTLEPLHNASLLLYEDLIGGDAGSAAWAHASRWADDRLTAWHSLKVNAVEAAWREDPAGSNPQAMQLAVLRSLRQGLAETPSLLPDAQLIQSMARAKHAFTFTQALRELRAEGLNLPEADSALKIHCAVAAASFRWLMD